VTCLATPVAHFAVVFTPGMYGTVTNGDLSFASSFALEIGGFVHVVVNAATDVGDGIGSGQLFGAAVYGKLLGLKRLFEDSNTASDLDGFGMVGAEVLDLALQCDVVLFF